MAQPNQIATGLAHEDRTVMPAIGFWSRFSSNPTPVAASTARIRFRSQNTGKLQSGPCGPSGPGSSTRTNRDGLQAHGPRPLAQDPWPKTPGPRPLAGWVEAGQSVALCIAIIYVASH